MRRLAHLTRLMVFGPVFFVLNGVTLRYELPSEWLESLRTAALRRLGARVGTQSYVRKGAFITMPKWLTIGSRSKLGPFSRLFLYTDFFIGDDVEIGAGLTVHTSEHIFDDAKKPLAKQGSRFTPVRIGSDVYIGSGVTLLAGAVIEDRVVVAAASVVRGTLPSGYVYGGVPARAIRSLLTEANNGEQH